MSFMSTSKKLNRRVTLLEEDDDRVRTCRVHLVRQPLIGPLAFHWLLWFDWGDYEAYAEGTDIDGKLTPLWHSGSPDFPPGTIQHDLGRINLSPKQVCQKVKDNKYNYFKYFLSACNCQDWARELASQLELHISIPRNILAPVVGSYVDLVRAIGNLFA